ncbi:Uncharacterized protein dnm_096030 [Desulfonema magnum]|uniref:Uncharacterized protein n=1 Tax=Desulfonema magnum TaxID=45655 RepID=A0A975BY54_9BACT|nr:Uncharacterized protein dnm_096030 [Desulfonema magnum]
MYYFYPLSNKLNAEKRSTRSLEISKDDLQLILKAHKK